VAGEPFRSLVDQRPDPIERPPYGRWTDARIRTALTAYLAGKHGWPSNAEYARDGMGQLRDAITRHGGMEHWAAQLGRHRATRNNGQRPYWTDTRIRDMLTSICTGRGLFPKEREFAERGLVGMYEAMRRRQGVDWWAQQVGLPRPCHCAAVSRTCGDRSRAGRRLNGSRPASQNVTTWRK
jgi:hypothetical protein